MTNILNKVINSDITADEILDWLTTDHPYDIVFPDVEQTDSTRIEFISYFLEYLRNQCQSVLRPTASDKLVIKHRDTVSDVSSKSITNIETSEYDDSKVISEYELSNGELSINSPIAGTLAFSNACLMNSNETSSNLSTPTRSYLSKFEINPNIGRYESPQSHSSPLRNDIDHSLHNDKDQNLSMQEFASPHTSTSLIDDSCVSNLSIASTTPCSPISPFGTSQATPISLTKKKGKLRNSLNTTDSPKRNANNWQTNKNHSKKYELTLGDFLTFEKSSSKKKNRNNSANQSMDERINKELNESNDAECSSVILQKKSRRRIKPTMISVNSNADNEQCETFGIVSRPLTINPKFLEDEISKVTSFDEERELLKLQRQNQPNIVSSVDTPQELTKNSIKPKYSSTIKPTLELVENKNIVDILAKLYGGLLIKNLIPNPMTELYFIISLITSQYETNDEVKTTELQDKLDDTLYNETESLSELKETMGCRDLIDNNSDENSEDDADISEEKEYTSSKNLSSKKNNEQFFDEKQKYFNTAHNCVYFAVTVLWNVKNLLSVFDRPTLALLCENTLIKTYDSILHEFLNKLYEQKCLQSKNIKPYNNSRTLQSNICFQASTDNRDNFPSVRAFTQFRMQRDLFYEILKKWEDNHLQPNWSMNMLRYKIETMISMHSDTVNYYHMARLFKSQLLASSIEIGQPEDTFCDSNLDVLKSLKDLNPEKLQQLQQRLITPVTSMGPVPPPSFPGVQEFYKSFILLSSDSNFIKILQDCFIQEILELNDTQFTNSDIDTKECKVDESTKQNYLWCISSLRLLAKFLGFVISLPYQTGINSLSYQTGMNLSQSETAQIELRRRIMPPLDLRECIYEAIAQKKLSLTVPWIVQYLAMLDSISFRLPYYLEVCKCLYCIYRDIKYSFDDESTLLLAFTIGWFFELSNFPKDIYFNWISSYENHKYNLTNDVKVYICKKNLPIIDNTSDNLDKINTAIDDLHIIDDRGLYICCPYLREFKLLLTSGNTNLNSNTTNRHITPVSTKSSQATAASNKIKLEMDLENAFFHSHPRSVRETVDFIVERVSSNCIKFISRTIIPNSQTKNFDAWKKSCDKNDIVASTLKLIKEESYDVIPKMCESKTKETMKSLLADDLLPSVKIMCIKIATRMEIERIYQWLDTYINNAITAADVFKDFDETKYNKNSDSSNKNEVDESDVPWATTVIVEVRNSIWELLENKGKWATLKEEIVLNNVNNIYKCLNQRKNTVQSAQFVLYRMSVDYAIHLIALRSDIFSSTIEEKLFEIWKMYNNNNNNNKNNNNTDEKLISGILSTRNVKILLFDNDKNVWIKYGKFIQQLLKFNLVTIDDFTNDCVSLLRHEWHPNVLQSFSKCILEAIHDYKCADESVHKIMGLLNWLIETCGIMDEYNYTND